MKFKVNDTVKLINDLPLEALSKGSIGVVVAKFTEPVEAYELEFCNDKGETLLR